MGAGPGDPELITVRGLRLLRAADVVLHDALVDPRLLAECRPDAELLNVGKRAAGDANASAGATGATGAGVDAGDARPSAHHNALAQERINALLVEKARTGRRVVRLKGGDPLVFGRATEELAALAAAGIACEIVPGVTTATAAAAAAQLPLTRRAAPNATPNAATDAADASSVLGNAQRGVLLVGGHPATGAGEIAWERVAALAPEISVCIYMGLKNLPQIARRLIVAGVAPSTPVTVVSAASLPSQHICQGTLHSASTGTASLPSPPAMVIIGSYSCAPPLVASSGSTNDK